MSELKKVSLPTAPVRTLDDVRNEYNQLAFRAGNLQYTIHAAEKDLDMLNESMRNLNFEAAKLQNEAASESAKKAEEAAAVEAAANQPPNLLKES